jgi:hypothetical protein
VYNDPHLRQFSGQYNEFQHEGDFKAAKTEDNVFNVHLRFQRFPGQQWTGITAAAILVNGIDVVKIYADGKVQMNNANFATPQNTNVNLKNGGYVKQSGSLFRVQGANDAYAEIQLLGKWMQFSIMNVNIYLPNSDKSTGFCEPSDKSGATPRGGLFTERKKSAFKVGAFKQPQFKSARAKQNAERLCLAAGHAKNTPVFETCLMDMLFMKRHKDHERLFALHAKVAKQQKDHREHKRAMKQVKKH